jgi:hypothetical protein
MIWKLKGSESEIAPAKAQSRQVGVKDKNSYE